MSSTGKRRDSDTVPIDMAAMIREYEAAQMARGIVEAQPTRSPPCPKCRDRSRTGDANDEAPEDERRCDLCFGAGSVTAEERRRYEDEQV